MGRYWKNTPGGPVWNSNTTVTSTDITTGTTHTLTAAAVDATNLVDTTGATALQIMPAGDTNSRIYVYPPDEEEAPPALVADQGISIWNSVTRPHKTTLYIDPFDPPTIGMNTNGTGVTISIVVFKPAAVGPSYWEHAPAGPVWNSNTTMRLHTFAGITGTLEADAGADVDITGCVACTAHARLNLTDMYISPGGAGTGVFINGNQGKPWSTDLYFEPTDPPSLTLHGTDTHLFSFILYRS